MCNKETPSCKDVHTCTCKQDSSISFGNSNESAELKQLRSENDQIEPDEVNSQVKELKFELVQLENDGCLEEVRRLPLY